MVKLVLVAVSVALIAYVIPSVFSQATPCTSAADGAACIKNSGCCLRMKKGAGKTCEMVNLAFLTSLEKTLSSVPLIQGIVKGLEGSVGTIDSEFCTILGNAQNAANGLGK